MLNELVGILQKKPAFLIQSNVKYCRIEKAVAVVANVFSVIYAGSNLVELVREGFKKKESKTWDIVPSSDTPSPPLNLGHPYVKYF